MVDVARLDPSLAAVVRAAVRASFLGRIRPEVRQRILRQSMLQQLLAGGFVSRLGETPAPAIVVQGTVGAYLSSRDDRSINARWITPGQAIGLAQVLGVRGSFWLRAVSDCTLLTIGSRALADTIAREPTLAHAVSRELAWELGAATERLADDLFSHMKHRVARHVLQRATEAGPGTSVHVTQQELADGVGSSADVVARALRELRDDGVLEMRRSGIHIRRAAALHRIAESSVLLADNSREQGRQLSLIG